MRISKNLRADQENIRRFLAVLGGASVELGRSKRAKPGFFILAHDYISGYIDQGFFRKEELLIKALVDGGFPSNEGPVFLLRTDQKKSRDAAALLINASKQWQAGSEGERIQVSWAASEYTSAMRQHLDRLKNLIFPLLEQNISEEDEQRIADGINKVNFEGDPKSGAEKYQKIIESLEDELSEWK